MFYRYPIKEIQIGGDTGNNHLIRVFPRRTVASPDDGLARFDLPTFWDKTTPPEHVRVSVAWDWDKERAEHMAREWAMICDDVQVDGPAYGNGGGAFWPGMFLKWGYTITSRGCPGRCWFCDVWRREGDIRELPIMPGHNVLDNNLLACSRQHIEGVFQMLAQQKQRPHFSGGLEAYRLQDWHVEWFATLKPQVMWFAYDTPDDFEPLVIAAKKLRAAGLMGGKHVACCYVLAGWNGSPTIYHGWPAIDTMEAAELRVKSVIKLGYFPQVMLLDDGRNRNYQERRQWKDWAAPWINKGSVGKRMKKILTEEKGE